MIRPASRLFSGNHLAIQGHYPRQALQVLVDRPTMRQLAYRLWHHSSHQFPQISSATRSQIIQSCAIHRLILPRHSHMHLRKLPLNLHNLGVVLEVLHQPPFPLPRRTWSSSLRPRYLQTSQPRLLASPPSIVRCLHLHPPKLLFQIAGKRNLMTRRSPPSSHAKR